MEPAMFNNFANVWTIIGQASALSNAKPIGLSVAGERIVLFRDAAQKAVALLDQCPHRGVALSLGRVERGEIECPFHGWRFNGAGANCATPFNPDAKRQYLHAQPLPLREDHGLLWLYTGFEPEVEPDFPETFSIKNTLICAQETVWRAHWTRVMENMLDMPHLPFVHRRTIGKDLAQKIDQHMDVFWRERPYGARIDGAINGEPRMGALEYRYPNLMELLIDPPGRIFRLMAICLPQDDTTTKLILLTIRDFARWPILNPIFRIMNQRIANEDKRIIESALPMEVPPPSEEASLRTDAPTLAFRRIYRQKLQGSSVAPPVRQAAP
jgi:phenylpropionate dioxygenase-like ring-hydroxylating dioxygenase large terminal subunit